MERVVPCFIQVALVGLFNGNVVLYLSLYSDKLLKYAERKKYQGVSDSAVLITCNIEDASARLMMVCCKRETKRKQHDLGFPIISGKTEC